jgi:hypothetical protein
MRTSEVHVRLLARLADGLLCLAGLSFIILLICLKIRGQLSAEVRISTFMIGCGGILLWLGASGFSTKAGSTTADPRPGLDRFWLSLRRSVEALAALGCAAMLYHPPRWRCVDLGCRSGSFGLSSWRRQSWRGLFFASSCRTHSDHMYFTNPRRCGGRARPAS